MSTFDNPSAILIIATWLPCFTGFISALSSTAIIYIIASDYTRKTHQQPNNRFLLILSVGDVFSSIAHMSTSMAIPKDSGKYAAFGNHLTCSMQGFLFQIGQSSPCYNACMCIWFLMSIKYNMHPKKFGAKVEPYCHAVSLIIPIGRAILCAAFDLYVPRGIYCGGSRSAGILVIVLGAIQLFIPFLIIIFCMVSIYYSFLVKEKMMRRYSVSSSGMLWRPNADLNGKKKAAKQGLLYSFAFFITYIFPLFNTFIPDKYHIFDILQSIFLPLQGLWNFILYSNRCSGRIRNEYPELNYITILWKMVFHPDEVRPRYNPRLRRRRSSAVRTLDTPKQEPKRTAQMVGVNKLEIDTKETAIQLEMEEGLRIDKNQNKSKNVCQWDEEKSHASVPKHMEYGVEDVCIIKEEKSLDADSNSDEKSQGMSKDLANQSNTEKESSDLDHENLKYDIEESLGSIETEGREE